VGRRKKSRVPSWLLPVGLGVGAWMLLRRRDATPMSGLGIALGPTGGTTVSATTGLPDPIVKSSGTLLTSSGAIRVEVDVPMSQAPSSITEAALLPGAQITLLQKDGSEQITVQRAAALAPATFVAPAVSAPAPAPTPAVSSQIPIAATAAPPMAKQYADYTTPQPAAWQSYYSSYGAGPGEVSVATPGGDQLPASASGAQEAKKEGGIPWWAIPLALVAVGS